MADEVLVLKNYIDGQFVGVPSYIDSFNPSTGKVHLKVPDSQAEDVDRAVAAASAAFPKWSRLTKQQRADYLYAIAAGIEKRLDEFAEAESRDQGKPVWLARSVDIPRAIYNFRFFAGAILYHTEKSSFLEAAQAVNYTTRTPLGVAGLITPWNLPLYLLTWKVAPALATGNTVVAKPSEMTSLTAYLMCQVFEEVKLPAGVCNIVFGLGPSVGSAIVAHPRVPLISFTGGTVTGRRISEASAPLQKRLSLELGGKNPCLIFDDVDLAKVVPEIVRASFTNQGEICLCSSRIYVQRGVFEAFVDQFVAQARQLKVGPPSQSDSKLGALVSREHLAKVQSYVDVAIAEGGTVRCGYTVDPLVLPAEHAEGYFMAPTVITGLGDASRCVREEIFGPVVVVLPFDTEDEAVARANDNEYGLSACVWCTDGSRAQRVANQLLVGTVWVNCWMLRDLNMPFGGMKASGTGRESATDSIEFYTEARTICTKIA
eukprot:m.31746 g.31746  ORF g.31746 m.31746 type:complete len:487 (-) comp9340_c0_seq2:163-1623(-)